MSKALPKIGSALCSRRVTNARLGPPLDLVRSGTDALQDRTEHRLVSPDDPGACTVAAPVRPLVRRIWAMKPIALQLELDCSGDEAALFEDLLVFFNRRRADPQVRPGPGLDRALGGAAARILGGIADDIGDFGIACRYDPATGKLAITDRAGAPNLGALPLLLIQLFPDKLPIPYRVSRPGSTNPPIWTVISEDRVLVTDDPGGLHRALAASPAVSRAKPRPPVH